MPPAVGLSLLVCVTVIGLVQMAVRSSVSDHRLAVAIVVLVALPVYLASPATSALLVLVAAMSLRIRPIVPTRVPPEWTRR